MIFDCINNDKIFDSIIIGFIMAISIIYYYITFESDYMMAIYSYNKQFDNYQNNINNISNLSISMNNTLVPISHNEIIKWNNKFRHPLIIPAFVNEQEKNDFIPSTSKNSAKRKNRNDDSLNVRSFEPKKRSDE